MDPKIVWEELKNICAADPKKALRLVMVTEANIRAAMKAAERRENGESNV